MGLPILISFPLSTLIKDRGEVDLGFLTLNPSPIVRTHPIFILFPKGEGLSALNHNISRIKDLFIIYTNQELKLML